MLINSIYCLLFLGEVISRHASLTEAEFDRIVSDWLRFAKQRKQRDDKAKENSNENEN